MDVHFLSEVYRGELGDKRLDVERLKKARPDFLVGVTEFQTGKGTFLDAKKESTIDAIQASCAAPILYRTPPTIINDTHYVDGSPAMPFPVHEIVERYNPTHVLVFANCAKEHSRPFSRHALEQVLATSLPKPLREALLSRDERFDDNHAFLKKSGIPYLILWSDKSLHTFTRNAKKVAAAADRAEKHLRGLIAMQK